MKKKHPSPSPEPKEETKIRADESMVKSTPVSNSGAPQWMIWALVVVIIVAGAWYFMQQPAAVKTTGTPLVTTNTTAYVDPLTTPGAVALLNSFDKLASLPNSYNLSMAEPIDNIDANISLTQQGADRVATITTAYDRRTYYWTGNQTIACEQSGTAATVCADINGSVAMQNYAIRLNATFPTAFNSAGQKGDQAKMIQLGALTFKAPPQARTVAGRSCTDLRYTFDFSHLTPSQLAQINMTTSDPLVSVFRNFQVEKCVDDQLGLALVSTLSYEYLDPNTQQSVVMGDELTYQTFQSPVSAKIVAPVPNASLGQFVQTTTNVDDLLAAVGGCFNVTNHDQCILSAAGNYKQAGICNQITNESARSQCVVIVATVDNTPQDCPMAGNQADNCYGEIALNNADLQYCDMIGNATLKAKCTTDVTQAKSNKNLTAPTGAPTGNALIPPPNNQSNGGLPTPSGNNSTVQRAAG